MLSESGSGQSLRSTERLLESADLLPATLKLEEVRDERGREPVRLVVDALEAEAKRKRHLSLILQLREVPGTGLMLFANDGRMGRRWLYLDDDQLDAHGLLHALDVLAGGSDASKPLLIWPHGEVTRACRALVDQADSHDVELPSGGKARIATLAYRAAESVVRQDGSLPRRRSGQELSHLDRLEAESIHIMREVAAQAENPVMLYSVGKDSSVMLHLARKAFYPSVPPFPLMHVDTRWKFQAMYDFRDEMARETGMELIVYINPEGVEKDINPFDHGSALHTDVMKTQGLKQALDLHGFDVAFGGARRDEEKSRAKERVFSFRTSSHRWDPKNQRPELWNLYNGYKSPGESIRVFPLSNWTELDIWEYIYREHIPIVPLYFAAERPVVERDGMLIMVDDDRMRLFPGEKIQTRRVRFRTLGCYPLTGAIDSTASDLSAIVLELLQSRTSERQGRAIDTDSSGSMEKKKQEGYF
ncbi:MAG: sulfate adenylyltransferase subunit CysD [Pseudomonadales bacterium]|nr:sulfate adenylyltransferase subunit CysD [Pseudomonadales bacterium]NIX07376.1 sulfate adenylyltransferase subunit CysD [Pseudomonadales bacterium]